VSRWFFVLHHRSIECVVVRLERHLENRKRFNACFHPHNTTKATFNLENSEWRPLCRLIAATKLALFRQNSWPLPL
jgi:hypothetical protein